MRSNQALRDCDDRRRGIVLGKRGESAQIGEQQRRLDRLAGAAPQRTGQHPRGAPPAEIGLERRRQRGARRQCGERRRCEARRLAEAVSLVGSERTRPDPAEPGPVRPRLDRVFMDAPGREPFEPAPAGVAGLTRRSWGRKPCWREAQGLDHLAAFGAATARCAGRSAGAARRASGRRRRAARRPRSGAGRAPPGTGRGRAFRRPRRQERQSGRDSCMDRSCG